MSLNKKERERGSNDKETESISIDPVLLTESESTVQRLTQTSTRFLVS